MQAQIKGKSVEPLNINISISNTQAEYLDRAGLLRPDEINSLSDIDSNFLFSVQLKISKQRIEEICDQLTLNLANVGFDSGYQLTAEGEIIENLIDKLTFSET